MTTKEFSDLLRKCSKQSYDFAKDHVINELPESFRYLLNINSPYEELEGDEECFPELSMKWDEFSDPMTHEDVIGILLRNGKVPEWIDISVFKTDYDHTYFTLTCCNRFTANSEFMYYTKNNNGPFGIKSPVFPPGWAFEESRKGKKFDLETRQKLLSKKSFGQRTKCIIRKP